jgi:nucleoside-diphosphate-sugar epimerase
MKDSIRFDAAMPSVSVLGCGWFGFPFARELVRSGYRVAGSTTSFDKAYLLEEAGIQPFIIHFPAEALSEPDREFFQTDVLVIAIPPRRKEGKSAEYAEKIRNICEHAIAGGVKHVLLISSTGVFPNANRRFIETDLPEPDNEASQALLDAERVVMACRAFSSTIIRFGGLFGEGRDPGRFFAGRKGIPNGLAPVNLIHLIDCIGICKAILEQSAYGNVFHACSPQHPARMDFYGRSAVRSKLPGPDFKAELLDWKVVDSVELTRLLSYTFKEKLTE